MHTIDRLRGQLSLELLLLFAIFLAALAMLSAAAFNTNNSAKSTVNGLLAQKAVSDIANVANDICVLGSGNKRQLHLSLADASLLSVSGQNITISYNNDAFSKAISCGASATSFPVKDNVLSIEKNGSTVSIILVS
ncbi:Uncharacterised protein [uncultured archaeon]|nr:Uncharacterised protein [uncultured archaeon]